jgi:hypothetical protein
MKKLKNILNRLNLVIPFLTNDNVIFSSTKDVKNNKYRYYVLIETENGDALKELHDKYMTAISMNKAIKEAKDIINGN